MIPSWKKLERKISLYCIGDDDFTSYYTLEYSSVPALSNVYIRPFDMLHEISAFQVVEVLHQSWLITTIFTLFKLKLIVYGFFRLNGDLGPPNVV